MAAAVTTLSLVTDYGDGGSHCGYCHSEEDTSYSYGMQAERITPECYQALLDRGWRRSGRWIYKPLHSRSCCQLITIRLDVEKFRPNKDQRRVQRKWDAHLAGEPLRHTGGSNGAAQACSVGREEVQGASPKRHREESEGPSDIEQWDTAMRGGGKRHRSALDLVELGGEAEGAFDFGGGASPTAELSEQFQVTLGESPPFHAGELPGQHQQHPATPEDLGAELTQELRAALKKCVDSGQLPDFPYPPPAVARATPKQRKKLPADVEYTSPSALAITGLANRSGRGSQGEKMTPEHTAQLLCGQMRLPRGVAAAEVANGFLNFRVPVTQGYRQKQPTPAAAPPALLPPAIPQSPPRHFELIMRPSSDSVLPTVEFDLYKKYQAMHHGDDPKSITMTSFRRFLCDSPVLATPASAYPPGGAPPSGFGSFHQQYWLDGRLIAVGVVDVLPRCLSSKYFFWDPDLASLSLGKLASLVEIQWVKEARAACASLKYYYMGFYIHNCHRMKYKAEFAPSDLLCPVAQCWVPIDRVQRAIASDARPPSLAAEPGALEGLGGDYLVTPDGRPAAPPRKPSAAEVAEVKLSVSMGGAREDGTRRRQVVQFGVLAALGVLNDEVAARLRRRLEQWMMMVGPAWRAIVYQ